jgi:cytoskeletal protein CcmA (bactofilin family)
MNTIGPTLHIAGDVTSDDDLTIDGAVRGRVTVRHGTLTVGLRANIVGDIRAPRVIVAGRVRGGVSAAERIQVLASAIVNGNLSANRIALADGARFDGGIDMAQRTIAAKVAQFRAAAR